MKIAFTYSKKEFNTRLLEGLTEQLPNHEIVIWEPGKDAPSNDIEVLLAMGVITREQMVNQPRLWLIQTVSAGYEGIDVEAATDLGIWVSYAPSGLTGNAVSVAEFAMMLILGASRHINHLIQPVRFKKMEALGVTAALYGKTVCIVGLGTIGTMLAERLIPFGMHIRATDDHPKNAPEAITVHKTAELGKAVADADYVVLCIRASKENEKMIDKRMLNSMKKGAMIINIARGSLIDEAALFNSIKSGHIAAAALDVVSNEPVDAKNPLLTLPQVLITPHVAGTTDITLAGTVDYVTKVLPHLTDGKKIKSIINQPLEPRHQLQ